MNSVWIGFDPREASAFAVARNSINRHLTQQIPVRGLVLSDLQARGLYTRPMEWRHGSTDKPIMWDVLSDAPMSTQHACARFLIGELSGPGWAMFVDGDILARGNIARLFESLDRNVPLYCVKHNYQPAQSVKMDGQIQTKYPKKNWSSVFILNVGHEANNGLTVDLVNSVPGRDLHAFCWLDESEIGSLDVKWNWLVGQSALIDDPQIVHFTDGVPDMPGYEDVPYADEWRAELARWAA